MKLKIAFIDILGLVYDGDTLKHRGLGGSESAVILMSRELVRLGFDVTVFNNCKDKTSSDGIYDGVRYVDLEDLKHINETFDVVISSRTVIPFFPDHELDHAQHLLEIFGINAVNKVKAVDFRHIVRNSKHRVVWLHDTFCSGDESLERLIVSGYINEAFVLSDWHSTYTMNSEHGPKRNFEVLKRNAFMTRNGMTRYHDEIDISKKDKNLFVYNASVTKGMVPLIENIWPKVKERLPNAKLKVIGGFYKFSDDSPGDEQEKKFWQLYHDNETKNLDVEFTGIIKQSEIADILAQASHMIYPGTFPETFGISTLESLYYCTPLITTRFGALEETAIEDISYMIDYAIEPNGLFPHISFEQQVEQFVNRVVEVYNNPYLHQQKQHACRKVRNICGWDSVALQWKQHFYRLFDLHMSSQEYQTVTKINCDIHNIFGRRMMNKEEFTFPKSNNERRIVVVTPFYNAENYIEKCIESVAAQDYDNYIHVLIDDVSTDDTYGVARRKIDSLPNDLQNRFVLIHNTENRGAVRNQIETIRQYANDDDIVILLDGDDWLTYRNDIFTYINTLHHDGADFTYGSCWSLADNIPLISQEYPKAVRENKSFRDYKFNWGMPYTHLRTFRGSLLKHESNEPFVDDNGNWYKAGGDNSVFYTAIENASNVVCVPEILYVYNDLNPLNDYKVNDEEQKRNANQIQERRSAKSNDSFTVVVPTMWRCLDITEKMLAQLTEHPLVHQIIVFDNDPSSRPIWSILSHDKILLTKLGDEDRNYFVNPCWNKGVELSETSRVCIWNDDVEFDTKLFDKIQYEMTLNRGVFGLIMGKETQGQPVVTDGSIDLIKWNWGDNIYGFGQLMFIRKENWTPIIDELQIWYGDDFIFHSHLMKKLDNYMIANIHWSSPLGCTTTAVRDTVEGLDHKERDAYGRWASENPIDNSETDKSETIMKKKILIAVPTNRNIEVETFKSIYDLEVPDGYETEFQYFYGYQIDQIRNLIADWAKNYDYLFSVDSDIVLPTDALKKMLAHDVDMVSGLYIQRIPDTHTLEVYKNDGYGGSTNIDVNEINFSQPLHEIVGCGFGCVLIKGEVFRQMEYPHFVYKSALNHQDTISEDIYFCSKAKEKGFRIYMDCTIQCEHVGSCSFVVQQPRQ